MVSITSAQIVVSAISVAATTAATGTASSSRAGCARTVDTAQPAADGDVIRPAAGRSETVESSSAYVWARSAVVTRASSSWAARRPSAAALRSRSTI